MAGCLRSVVTAGLLLCVLLLCVLPLGIAGAGSALGASAPITGPVMTPRYWAQTCMRERLGFTGRDLAAWHRWCAGIQPKRHNSTP